MTNRLALLAVLSFSVLPAAAYSGGSDGGVGLHTATAIGARAVFYKPTDADSGNWSPGVQLRLHGSDTAAFEMSADFTHHSFGGTSVNEIPIQFSLLGFFYPETSLSPYVIVGGGWYRSRVEGPGAHSEQRFGPHAGLGLQLLLNDGWSIDGSYRYLWTQSLRLQDPSHPVGQNFSSRGYLISTALNYRL